MARTVGNHTTKMPKNSGKTYSCDRDTTPIRVPTFPRALNIHPAPAR